MGLRLQQAGALVLLFVTSSVTHSADPVSARVPPCDPWAAKVASVQGNVEAKRNPTANWQLVTLNEIYCPGDQIRVGDNARAAIVLNNETLVRLNQNSAITLAEIKTDGPSLLELLEGIAHFISRVPRSLKVNTPFVNAAIEGTEFVVAIGNQQTEVTVFEGSVLTKNEYGEVRIAQNETAIAKAGSAPQKVLKATPRDAVQWALYFPPVFDQASGNLASAQQLLYTGQIDAARAALKDDSSAEALSLMAIIAVVQNNSDDALKSAQQAVEKNPQLAAAHIALSYAQQAKRDLDKALTSAKQATTVENNNAIAWARVAELQLSTGDLSDALDAAQRATQLNPNLARTQTILGFAYLLQIDIDEAKATFNKAIELDQVDPLPRLGLGLAKIRKNDLAEGRRDIEIAASLDPNNAIIRSYLGKAYFEEKRAPLDAEQFAMAKELDPNDPTPWFYDALRKQTENDPVGALEDLNKSIDLNDNRAVYRSSLQLDQDEAARSASQARIYQDLGFEQLAINEASKSIAQDPANYSAHALLADSYLSKPRHEIARVSETLQAKLLNPLNSNAQPLQLTQGSLTLLNNLGTYTSTSNEYNSLFQRNSLNLTLAGLEANNKTSGHEAILSGVYDWLALSAGTYDYKTDGFHSNNGQDQQLNRYFAQARITNNVSVFLERLEKEETLGDLLRFDITDFIPSRTTNTDENSNRVGLLYRIDAKNSLVATHLKQKSDFVDDIAVLTLTSTQSKNTDTYEFKYNYDNNTYSMTAGYSDSKGTADVEFLFFGFPFDAFIDEVKDSSVFLYNYIKPSASLDLTVGISQEKYSGSNQQINIDGINPKLGMQWMPTTATSLRLAYFETLRRTFVDDATIEPTFVAGFNQFFDDEIGTESKQSAIALDQKIENNLIFGVEYLYRDLDSPQLDELLNPIHVDMLERTASAYVDLTVNSNLAISIKAQREHLIRGNFPANDTYEDILTYRYPISFHVFYTNNIKSNVTFTYIDQRGTYIDGITLTPYEGEDNFWTTDINFSIMFPNRLGTMSLGVKNLFDEQFSYQETDPKNPRYARERIGFVNINIFF